MRMGHTFAKPKMTDKARFTELEAADADGNVRSMGEWAGKVVMVINVASA